MDNTRSDEAFSADDEALGAELRSGPDEKTVDPTAAIDELDDDVDAIDLDDEATVEPDEEDEAILDLSTLAPTRQKVRIDGNLYEMAMPSDLGAVRQQQVFARSRIIDKLVEKNKLSQKEKDSLELAITQAARMILPEEIDGVANVTDDVFDQLNDDHKRAVIDGFFAIYAEKRSAHLVRLLRRTGAAEALRHLISES